MLSKLSTFFSSSQGDHIKQNESHNKLPSIEDVITFRTYYYILFVVRGAENGTRTRDLRLGKPTLYQLSYFRIAAVLRMRLQR